MKTPDEIYDILDKALAAKKAAGFEIVERSFGNEANHTCCALTAYSKDAVVDMCMREFGNTAAESWAIVDGFDGNASVANEYCERALELYKVGERLREKYITE